VSGARPALNWQPDGLYIADTRFLVSDVPEDYLNTVSSADGIVLAKSRGMVEDLLATVQDRPTERIVDIGIFKGGSTALLAAALQPLKLTALDVNPEPVETLETFIAANGLSEIVRPRYGVDQADIETLLALIEEDHGGEPLDLVIDDASHLYRESRTTFEVLFPRLRPGGVYMIEDWSWAHFAEPMWQAGGGWFHDRPALTNLVIEVLMMLGTSTDIVAEVIARHDSVHIIRGPESLSSPMRLDEHYLNRGLPFRPLM
jgi:predicted O-methyltransferase YrrM